MTIALVSVAILHERRLRLVFTTALAAGAFGAPTPSYYTLQSLDAIAPSPTINAALIVANSPNVVELALGSDLVVGGLYEMDAVGVPAQDSTVTAAGTLQQFRFGQGTKPTNVEPLANDRRRLLYGADILWNESDYEETPDGDLARVEGTANVTKALWRGIESQGLPWDSTYGGRAREYVDSPSPVAGTLLGSVSAQILRDPRVKALKSSFTTSGSDTYLTITPTLVSGDTIQPVSVTVPNASA